MQIFITDKNLIQNCENLDSRRLHKQLLEIDVIIKAIEGTSEAYKNHPVVKMYQNHKSFLYMYERITRKYWDLYTEYKNDKKIGFGRLIENLLKAKNRKDLEEYGRTQNADPLGITAIFVNPIADLWEDVQKVKYELMPSFITQEYINLMRSNLYHKDPVYYTNFEKESKLFQERYNMYFVDGEWKKYYQKEKK